MKKTFQKQAFTTLGLFPQGDRTPILLVGVATFFFGFFAGAVLNVYLILIHSPLVASLRSSLTYKSAILGDGILLPLVDMVACAFLLKHKAIIQQKTIRAALFFGALVTIYFHVSQAVNHLVNWAMPTPWHWNVLGVWHAAYMFSVASFLSLFYLVAFRVMKREKYVPRAVWLATVGLVVFFILLRLDYISLDSARIIFR